MKTSERLLNASKTIWDAYNEHPFVRGIQNGTLERDKFRYYIMQDFLYLKDYAKTYAVGVAKAKSVETANLFAKYINVMNGELDVHKGYPTKRHYELLDQYGIQPFYRKSFLKKRGYV